MRRFTVRGSAALEARIGADMQRIAAAAAPLSRAGILIGGYGRGEGTPQRLSDGSQAPFNDYDLVVVVDRLNPRLRKTLQALEAQLSREVGLPVDLCPYCFSHLRRCEFSLLNYEMKYGHRVIWGPADILSALPAYPHDALPRTEGTRLLLNRGRLLLDIRQRLAQPQPLSDEERLRFIKFIRKVQLAFGDCALLAAGRYDIAYAVKKVRFTDIGLCPDRDYVVEHYLAAIALKEQGDYAVPDEAVLKAEFETVCAVFLRFLPWYRSRAAGREGRRWKNLLLNLMWMHRLGTTHPRIRLYDVLPALLEGRPALPMDQFCRLQRRFS